jgi:hypothetical protein
MNVALTDFIEFIEGAELIGDRLDFDIEFFKGAVSISS